MSSGENLDVLDGLSVALQGLFALLFTLLVGVLLAWFTVDQDAC